MWDHLVRLVAALQDFEPYCPLAFPKRRHPHLSAVLRSPGAHEGILKSTEPHLGRAEGHLFHSSFKLFKVGPHSYVNFNDIINTHAEKCTHCESLLAFS